MAPTNPHLTTPLRWEGVDPERARIGVILLHGRGRSPALVDALVRERLQLDDIAYALPSADESTWYPGGFMQPFEDNEPRLGLALDAIDACSDAFTERGLPPERQVVAGFSQGACLGCEYVYRAQRRFAGLVAFTGGLLGPAGTTWADHPVDAWRGMSVLLGGAEEDPWVPAPRMRETAEVFRAGGAKVDIEFVSGADHTVTQREIERARQLLLGLPELRLDRRT